LLIYGSPDSIPWDFHYLLNGPCYTGRLDLTGEALGLFYAGILFREVRPAQRWCQLGARILAEQSARQVLPDGVYFEQSTCYQRYTVEIYLHFLILAARSGRAVPAAVGERVRRMLDFLLALRRPDGSIPHIGDADGGWLLPLASRSPDDCRGVFSTAAVFFARRDYAWAAGGVAPETLWLLGAAASKAFEALRPAPPGPAPSRLFPHGGYAVMRSGCERDAHCLIFDAGPVGCPMNGGHGHADLLSIQCAVFGLPYLVDAGTYCYTSDPQWRDFFRSTDAHSTAIIDGMGQAIPAGPFHWQSRPRARLRRWLSTERLDFADAEHEGYRRLADPVTHRRRVLFVKPRYWVVVDDLEGAAEHRLELRFQFAPMPVTVDSALWARAAGPGGHGLLIRPFASVPLKAEVIEGELGPIRGWVSPNYGQRQPAPVVIYTTVTQLPLRIVTLLFPVEDASAPFPAVFALAGDGPGPVGLAVGGDGSYYQGVTLVQPLETNQAFARFDYALSDAVTFYVQGTYAEARSDGIHNSNERPNSYRIFSGNPFLPANAQAQLTPAANFQLGRLNNDLSAGIPDSEAFIARAR